MCDMFRVFLDCRQCVRMFILSNELRCSVVAGRARWKRKVAISRRRACATWLKSHTAVGATRSTTAGRSVVGIAKRVCSSLLRRRARCSALLLLQSSATCVRREIKTRKTKRPAIHSRPLCYGWVFHISRCTSLKDSSRLLVFSQGRTFKIARRLRESLCVWVSMCWQLKDLNNFILTKISPSLWCIVT